MRGLITLSSITFKDNAGPTVAGVFFAGIPLDSGIVARFFQKVQAVADPKREVHKH
jgi:hypothetical protein